MKRGNKERSELIFLSEVKLLYLSTLIFLKRAAHEMFCPLGFTHKSHLSSLILYDYYFNKVLDLYNVDPSFSLVTQTTICPGYSPH